MRHIEDPGGREGRRGRRRPGTSYGSPPIHKPHWKWLIIWYFFLGGLSAGSSLVATVADFFGAREDRDTVRAGRYLAMLAVIPCPILLILDLGRPERFLNMLRVFKLRSPMSLGTWGLLSYSGFAMLSTAAQGARDGLDGGRFPHLRWLPERLIAATSAPFGFFLGGYTGVLLGATAVPIWAKNARLLGPLFLSSALAASCAAISLILALLPGDRRGALGRLQRAEMLAAGSELSIMAAIHLNSGRLGAPLMRGRLGRIHLFGSVGLGIVVPLVLHRVGHMLRLPHRPVTVASSIASLVGGFIVKYAVVMAGHASADDPAATFEFAGGQTPPGMSPTVRAPRH